MCVAISEGYFAYFISFSAAWGGSRGVGGGRVNDPWLLHQVKMVYLTLPSAHFDVGFLSDWDVL